ncbi:MAG: dihydroxyacetone kinase subunit L [Clostridium sp.]
MLIDKVCLGKMFLKVAELWKAESVHLSEIDSRFGDGDHGVTINKIAMLIEKKVLKWGDESLGEFIEDLGDEIMAVNGGSAGPLYGTMVGGLAEPLNGVKEIDGQVLKDMFLGSLSAMEDITKAKVGDKTMMDALIPAVIAAQEAGDDVEEILLRAKAAAIEGAKASEGFISKYGRAKSYKEQTIGTPDAGAVSASIFFVGLADGIC